MPARYIPPYKARRQAMEQCGERSFFVAIEKQVRELQQSTIRAEALNRLFDSASLEVSPVDGSIVPRSPSADNPGRRL